MNFFGFGESNKKDEDSKQTMSLVDNDAMSKQQKKKKKQTKTVKEASKAADDALQATMQMTDAMTWWNDSEKVKAKPDRLKKASGKSPTNDWWKIGGEGVGGGLMGDDSIVSGMSDISGLDMNLGLDDIEEFKPIAAFGAFVGENPVSKIDVADRLQNVEKKIEKEK